MIQAKRFLLAVLGTAAIFMFSPVEAAKGPSTAPSSAAKVKKCAKGEIWNKAKKTCIKTQSGILPDEDLFWQGRELALGGEYDWAIQVFSAMADQNDPEVLKFLGYSHRKAGRFEIAVAYYRRALALDPDNVVVREYLGEGYVATGRIDLARAELAEIEKRCGTSCEAYEDLAGQIAATAN